MMAYDFFVLSFAPLLIGILASVACALPGNFLILRKQALIGDALSHVVLPGIVVAFLVTGLVSTWPMMIGALIASFVAVGLIQIIQRVGRIEQGAAMGVVFTAMFAFGVLLLERTDTSKVHLDVQHALYGNLESLIWLDYSGWGSLTSLTDLSYLPVELWRMAGVACVIIVFTVVFWRSLKLISFDEQFASTQGVRVGLMSTALIGMAALAAVAAFDAVGSIIVIAMFICPPAIARLVTNSLRSQVWLSIFFATLSTISGFYMAAYGPRLLGYQESVSAAGMIATVSGVFLAIAAICGPYRKANS